MGSINQFCDLYDELCALHQKLREYDLGQTSYVAEIAGVPFERELDMQNGIHELNVMHHTDNKAVRVSKRAWQEYFVEDGASTKYVKRYAGFIVCQNSDALALISQINNKNEIKDCVRDPYISTSGQILHRRNHRQKHEFIHEAAPRIMTVQLYRHIKVISDPVQSLSFSWTQKSAPLRMSKQQALNYVGKHYASEEVSSLRKLVLEKIELSSWQVFEKPRVHNAIIVISRYDGKSTANIQATTPIVISNPIKALNYKPVRPHVPEAKREIKSERARELLCERTGVFGVESRSIESE